MPLDTQILRVELMKVFDFKNYPNSLENAAQRWANAFHLYAKNVIPFSTTSEQAKKAFVDSFLQINFLNGKTQFPLCFISYASILASGMLPTFLGTPPIGTPLFESVYSAGYSGKSSETCVDIFVGIVDSWMKTGIAVNISTTSIIKWV